MKTIRAWFIRFRGLFRKPEQDHELGEELASHIEFHIEDNLRAGMTREEARRSALLKLGGIEQTKEIYRDRRGLPLLETLLGDIRFSLRMLLKNPGFTAVAVLTLALGIGANTAIFSVVNAVLLRPLPFPNSDRLVRIEEMHPGGSNANFTYASYLDLERDSITLESVAAFRPWSFNLTGEGEPEQVSGALVSGGFFRSLGVSPLLGRTVRSEDDQSGGDNQVVVLSYALWQSRFGSDRKILGRVLRISAEDYRVVGVMPRGFDYPEKSRLWCPLVSGGSLRTNRRAHLLTVIANLPAGGQLGSAQGELSALAARIENQNPGVDPDMVITLVTLKKSLVAPVQPALLVLIFAVGLLLLIACANLANLQLARAAARQKEFAIRAAMGAGWSRLARQMLTESLVVALLGAILGLGIAWESLQFIVALNKEQMPRFEEIGIDWQVMGFTLLVSLLAGMLVGLAPAVRGAKTDLNTSLKEGASVLKKGKRQASSQLLVIPQFALAVVLLVGAGLLANSFVRLLRLDPGFHPNGLLSISLFLSPIEYPEGNPKGPLLLHQILENIRAVQGTHSVGLVNALPITGGPNTDFVIEGRPAPPANDEPSADIRTADRDYFRTMGIPLIAGREFTEADNARAVRVVVINQTMAREYWPGENPIGQHITMKDWGPPLTGEIIGIVGDIKTNGLDASVGPMIYWPYYQFPQLFNTIVVRTDGDAIRLVPALKSAIWAIDKNQPISKMENLETILAESLARRRLYMILLGVFSCAALLLAAVGIYGMVSHSVSQRTREMGIRLAMGAERRDVLLLVLKQGTRVALLGIAAGIAGAFALTRLMSHLLFGVSATDPITMASVGILLLLVALVACCIPARRAMRVEPIVALRYE